MYIKLSKVAAISYSWNVHKDQNIIKRIHKTVSTLASVFNGYLIKTSETSNLPQKTRYKISLMQEVF